VSGAPLIVRAPARVNLIGEHADYNEGYAIPVAIDRFTSVAISPRTDRCLRVHSVAFAETVEFALDQLKPPAAAHWSDYIRGVAWVLEMAGQELRGADLRITSDMPIGSGLGSSAALEVACGYALLQVSGLEVNRPKLAQWCQQAESEYIGVRCGIMEQFIACQSETNRALLLDCRSLEGRQLPIGEGWSKDVKIVVCNTMIRALGAGERDRRRADCEAAVRFFSARRRGVQALRDVDLPELQRHKADMPPTIYRRCRHVIGENARVLAAAEALERQDLPMFGRLMTQSHDSLRDDYEVSCSELDLLVQLALAVEGVYGARMTGGGFGGCTVNLVRAEATERFARAIARGYHAATGRQPEIFVCTPSPGVHQVAGGGGNEWAHVGSSA
jgi:galactokinase